MNRRIEKRNGRVTRSAQPVWIEFSELLALFDDQLIIVADGAHWLIDDDGATLREVRVRWRDQ